MTLETVLDIKFGNTENLPPKIQHLIQSMKTIPENQKNRWPEFIKLFKKAKLDTKIGKEGEYVNEKKAIQWMTNDYAEIGIESPVFTVIDEINTNNELNSGYSNFQNVFFDEHMSQDLENNFDEIV